MKRKFAILLVLGLLALMLPAHGRTNGEQISFDFYGDTVSFNINSSLYVAFDDRAPGMDPLSGFMSQIGRSDFAPVLAALRDYREKKAPDDWLYYQLVRRVAQELSPKAENYWRYTLYKFYLMLRSGYDPILAIHKNKILFYIQCDENIYNIPYRIKNGKQYVCLNYHDYGSHIDFTAEKFDQVYLPGAVSAKAFSYKISRLPDFKKTDYVTRRLNYMVREQEYYFKIKVNPELRTIFKNYPVVDYGLQFNTPVSEETRTSLIPLLQKKVAKLDVVEGVDYLMQFSRYAFVFEPDSKVYGSEKRLSAEQTLLAENSDCEDRAALFFYLVKEVYNLPMIVLVYPRHVTVAVKFEKPVGDAVVYKGEKYTICEPTPQVNDLPIGSLSPGLKKATYEVAYVYHP